jgi:dTDP-4-amino-4,6-dideoxygalactose transaminase
MDDLRASLGIAQLGKIRLDLESRAQVRERYIKNLSCNANLTIPFVASGEFSSNYIFTVVINGADASRRDQVRELLASSGIQTSIHYPPVHSFSTYQTYSKPLVLTEMISNQIITLPMYSALTMTDVDYICEKLIEICDAE